MTALVTAACAPDTFVISGLDRVPGQGTLLCNAFLIRGREPTLIDTCASAERAPFMAALRSLIDPAELRWIFLTHEENDHAGNLEPLLAAAPRATVVAQFQAIGKLSHEWPVPIERVFLANPGQSQRVGDRVLRLVRPPLFDSPATSAIFDESTGVLFSSDCFGAFISAPTSDAATLDRAEFERGLVSYNRANHPWVHGVDAAWFARALDGVRELSPRTIASSHGPLVHGRSERLLELFAELPRMERWLPPDQARLRELLGK